MNFLEIIPILPEVLILPILGSYLHHKQVLLSQRKNIRGSAAINRKETLNNLCLAAKCDPGSAAVRARSPADISEAGISLLEACLHLCFCAKEAGNPCSVRSSRSNRGDAMLLSPFECKAQRGPLHVPACELFNCPAGYK